MKVIDFHVHPYLTKQEYLGMYQEVFYIDRMKAKEDLQDAFITKICGSVIEKEGFMKGAGFEHIKMLNRKALELKKIYGDFYIPGFHVHPDFVKESCDEIEFMSKNGIRLIGELVPYMHGWTDYANQNFSEILDVAEQYGMIINYHTVNEEHENMEKMIAQHPNLTFVAAHPGQKGDFLHHIERMKQYENAYLDLSGTGLFRYGILAYGVEKVGYERFLFGTDYPICNPRMYVQAVLQEHISEEAKEAIFYRNAERILGL